jgi:LPS-assembly lipoprotein
MRLAARHRVVQTGPMIRILPAALLALALSACGFHFRNAISLPQGLGPLRVVSTDPYSPLADSLAQALERAGATTPAGTATEKMATLRILSERWGDTPLSVDAFGRSQEYTLRHAVIFEMRAADDTILVPEQAIELTRDYISSPTKSLGTGGEREILAAELQREMVAAVMRRIDIAIRASASATDIATPPPTP